MKTCRVLLIVIAFFLMLSLIQFAKIRHAIEVGNYPLEPWQQIKTNASYKVLFAGDSTAVGTGLLDNSKSTSGLLSHDYPNIDLENYSHNGLRLRGLAKTLKTIPDKKFDLAVLQIGANDIIFLTPMNQIKGDLKDVLKLAKHMAKKIIILHSGDVGESPLFIWPFKWIYTWRSLKVRDFYRQSQDSQVSYLDIYTLNQGRNYNGCYARDSLHLNEHGYAIWYGFIKNQLKHLHWLP